MHSSSADPIHSKRPPETRPNDVRLLSRLSARWLPFAGLWLCLAVVFTAIAFAVERASAQVAPGLTIAPAGTNQFVITITNGVATTNYTLLWTPALADDNYPWEVLNVSAVGQTNWTVDGTGWPNLFFRVFVGADRDADTIQDWQDADPNDPTVGILTITIDSPLNGTVFN